MFWVQTPHQISDLQVFSPSTLSFHFLDGVIGCTEVFNSDKVQFIRFSFLACAFGVLRNHCLTQSDKDLFFYFFFLSTV